ncbi:hypothetical protein R1flu_009179 [Riccia fluitans]|uniref:Uncharacterized protein n=1 Tax=Riccia fluitans TaxID=41844 RepID=A0ABD1Z1C7_9MARC
MQRRKQKGLAYDKIEKTLVHWMQDRDQSMDSEGIPEVGRQGEDEEEIEGKVNEHFNGSSRGGPQDFYVVLYTADTITKEQREEREEMLFLLKKKVLEDHNEALEAHCSEVASGGSLASDGN